MSIWLEISGPITKRCPYVDEVDDGNVTLTFTTDGENGPELHALAATLRKYADRPLSHEALATDLLATTGASIARVTFTTAGLDVTAEAQR